MGIFKPSARQRRQIELEVRGSMARERMGAARQVAVQLKGLYDAADPSRFRKDRRETNVGHVAVEFDEHEAEQLRGKSRWLFRHSGAYRAPILAATVEIVGDGLFPMGRNDLARDACAMFRRWGSDPVQCDIRGLRTLPLLQRAELIDLFVDGDHGLVMTKLGSVQPITADRILNPKREANRPTLAGGVETDAVGRVIAFYVAKWAASGHYLDHNDTIAYPHRWFSFLNCPDVAEAIRTPPLLIAALDRIQDLEEFIDNTMTASKWASSITGLLTSDDPPAAQGMLEGAHAAATNNAPISQSEITLENGTLFNWGANAKIQQIEAKHPNAQFEAFIAQLMRIACASIRFPYEIAMQDFSASNFSTAKAIRMQAEEFATAWRRMYVEHRLLRIYHWKVRSWQARGLLPVGPEADAKLFAVEVPPPPRRFIDPQKEAAADILRIQHGLDTKERVISREGRDPDAVRDQRAREVKADAAAGLSETPLVEGSPGVPRTSGGGADNDDEALREKVEDILAERAQRNGTA